MVKTYELKYCEQWRMQDFTPGGKKYAKDDTDCKEWKNTRIFEVVQLYIPEFCYNFSVKLYRSFKIVLRKV